MTEDKDCHPWDKPYYYVWEVAQYWCRVANRPIQLDEQGLPVAETINHCIRPRAEWIMDAMQRGELRYGRDGKVVGHGDPVSRAKRTATRSDLRKWFVAHRSERPPFLFDDIERGTHAAINTDSFEALQADLQAARSSLQRANEHIKDLEAIKADNEVRLVSLRAIVDKAGVSNGRVETTYLNIIGALLGLLLGTTPSGKPYSQFRNQAAIIDVLLAHHHGKQGITTRTLENKFAEARRRLKST